MRKKPHYLPIYSICVCVFFSLLPKSLKIPLTRHWRIETYTFFFCSSRKKYACYTPLAYLTTKKTWENGEGDGCGLFLKFIDGSCQVNRTSSGFVSAGNNQKVSGWNQNLIVNWEIKSNLGWQPGPLPDAGYTQWYVFGATCRWSKTLWVDTQTQTNKRIKRQRDLLNSAVTTKL